MRTARLVTLAVVVVAVGALGDTWYRHHQHQDRLDAQCRRLIAASLGYSSTKGIHGGTASQPVPDGLVPPHGTQQGGVCREGQPDDLIITHYAVFDVPSAHAAADAVTLSDVAGYVCHSTGLPTKRGETRVDSFAQVSMYCSTTIPYQGLKTLIFADFYRRDDGNYRFVEWWTVGEHGRLKGRDDS